VKSPQGSIAVAMVLAFGVCVALNLFVVAVLYDALINGTDAGLSENATQVLSGVFGGAFGVIGAVVGYQVGKSQPPSLPPEPPAAPGPGAAGAPGEKA
jgi:hypothetical protein